MARLLLLLAVAGCSARDHVVSVVEPAPKLVISQSHQSFGGVEVGTRSTATVRISNTGDGPSAPLAPALSGDAAFTVDGNCSGTTLAPAASCDLRVTFAPRAFGRAAAAVAMAGPLAFSVDGYGRGTVKLSLQSTGGGSLNFCPFGGGCVITFDVGDTVRTAHVEATPDAEWAVLGWSGDCAGSASSCDLPMDRDRSVVVVFAKLATVTVEATALAGGAGEIRLDASTACQAPCRLSKAVLLGTRIAVHATPDPASQFRWTDGCHAGGGDCTQTIDNDTSIKAVFNGANYVFVTSTKHSSAEGVAAYDAACNESARKGGLPGPYLAWISTTTTPAERRVGSARGFIRLDGLPFIDVLDPAAPAAYPVVFEESGQPAPNQYLDRVYFSGHIVFPTPGMLTCHDWTSDDPSQSDGSIVADPLGGSIFWNAYGGVVGCSLKFRLLCVGTALSRPLHAAPARGRIAFTSNRYAGLKADAGIGAFDAKCAAEARGAGLPGSYKALVATDGASAVSRFDLSGPPWVRPDGVAVVARAADLAEGKLLAPIDLQADSTLDREEILFWTGASTPATPGTAATTCNGWTSSAAGASGMLGSSGNIEPRTWFDLGANGCVYSARVYCLQE